MKFPLLEPTLKLTICVNAKTESAQNFCGESDTREQVCAAVMLCTFIQELPCLSLKKVFFSSVQESAV